MTNLNSSLSQKLVSLSLKYVMLKKTALLPLLPTTAQCCPHHRSTSKYTCFAGILLVRYTKYALNTYVHWLFEVVDRICHPVRAVLYFKKVFIYVF